ncbi:hypothetical protein [Burkholderia sp. 3C]
MNFSDGRLDAESLAEMPLSRPPEIQKHPILISPRFLYTRDDLK